MTELALLIKSYSPDFEYAKRLMNSINAHNKDSLPVFLVAPASDVSTFQVMAGANAEVLSEELFASHLVHEETAGFSPGYINQEIVKLSFWELGLCDNYFCVDSDAVFIRDFTRADFMARPGVPFTFLTEDRALHVEPGYYADTWINRMKSLQKIRAEIDYQGRWLLTVHGHAVFSATVLKSFVNDFLRPRGWDYKDALAISPYEPTWYNTWLLHTGVIEIVPREPIVKTFHNSIQHLDYLLREVTTEDLARGYVAAVVNSNYSRGDGVLSLTTSPTQLLASYISFGDLFKAFGRRFKQRVIVEKRPLRSIRVYIEAQMLKVPGLRSLVNRAP
jgi:hypothetical protein